MLVVAQAADAVDPAPPRWFKPSSQPLGRIEWHGAVEVPTPGDYRFFLGPPARVNLWIDDRPATGANGTWIEWRALLAAGRHRIRISVESPVQGRFQFFWLGPDGHRKLLGGES